MERSGYLDLLHDQDDLVHTEWPGGWNLAEYQQKKQQFVAFAADLQAELGLKCTPDFSVQDASFHAQVDVPPECKEVSDYALSVRASNFGNFATVYDDEEVIKPVCLSQIKWILKRHGYRYIPSAVLAEPYNGTIPSFSGSWGVRYFDYL